MASVFVHRGRIWRNGIGSSRIVVVNGEVVGRQICADWIGRILLHNKAESLAAGSQPHVVDGYRHLSTALTGRKVYRLAYQADIIIVAARVAVALVRYRAGVNRRRAQTAGPGDGEGQMAGIFVHRSRIW